MLEILFWVVVGMIIGWNIPQPFWAKPVTDKIVATLKDLKKKLLGDPIL